MWMGCCHLLMVNRGSFEIEIILVSILDQCGTVTLMGHNDGLTWNHSNWWLSPLSLVDQTHPCLQYLELPSVRGHLDVRVLDLQHLLNNRIFFKVTVREKWKGVWQKPEKLKFSCFSNTCHSLKAKSCAFIFNAWVLRNTA